MHTYTISPIIGPMSFRETDVLIVGAGPTGLLLACELARRGIEFRIIDRLARSPRRSRALGLQARNLEVFDDLGIVDEALRVGTKLPAANIYANKELKKRLELLEEPSPSKPYPVLLILEQHKIEQILTRKLKKLGVMPQRRTSLDSLSQTESWVQAELSNGESWRCKYLVGCDGARSRVRDSVGITFDGATYPKAYILAELKVDWDLSAELHRFMGEEEDLVAVPLGEDRFRLTAWDESPDSSRLNKKVVMHAVRATPPKLKALQEKVDRLVPGQVKLSDPKSLIRYRVDLRLASKYRKGRVLVAGDAAHVHSPTGAQGMNTGLGDAYNLGWRLALVVQGVCDSRLLESYETERRPIGQWVLSGTHQVKKQRSRRVQFELTGRRFYKMGSRLLMARWNQLELNYRSSPIVAHLHETLSGEILRAGDRAPDGTVVDTAKGEDCRLFDIYRGTSFHLLYFVGKAEGESEIQTVVSRTGDRFGDWIKIHRVASAESGQTADLLDPDGNVFESYGIDGPTLILIRPDGHLAARADEAHCPQFLAYLYTVFVNPKLVPC
jgi:2-polyprenyl-6-methoxyphenol hydroxylase-like FAD-dependent oxidoreductase